MRTPEQISADYERAKRDLENAFRRIETEDEWRSVTRTAKRSTALDALIPPQRVDPRLTPIRLDFGARRFA